ncbi:hypothetical protein BDN70DRAFT_891538 [Pholiota conissans]|uniref:F-box domain-containing protein n=1 Tax=Pholiota conissans TaxID=109636 RepID=A0A9P5Z8W9_9AGAR|nr:hypothetical protein BDN70DRAFT_891538 [Pholiota conissans]
MLCDQCGSLFERDPSRSSFLHEDGTHNDSVTGLEDEMASVEMMMEKLVQRKIHLRRRINALSLTARLPPEILIYIFRIASQDGERPIPPLFFGSICKEWRDIAWSTPLLWNSVSVHVSRQTHGSQIQLLGDWLLRAKTAPLFIKLTSDDEHEAIFCSLQTIMDVLVTRSMYWYSLDCLLPPQCHELLKNNHFPMLASVSIRPPKGTISTFSESPNMFLSAPKLLDVDLSGYNFPSMVLPWEQLRRFKTHFLTVAECLKVIRRSSNLKECHLESVYSPEIIPSPISDTLQSELETLDVMLIKGGAISLLDGITLPCLRELRVHYSGVGGFLLSAISSLVMRSGCNVQKLCIEKHNFRDDDLISCLETMPSVTHLSLNLLGHDGPSFTGLTSKFIATLDPTSHPGRIILPNLTSFEFRGQVLCDVRILLYMVGHRWRSTATDGYDYDTASLASVKIFHSNELEVSPEREVELDRLRAEGMLVTIHAADEFSNTHHHCKSASLFMTLIH